MRHTQLLIEDPRHFVPPRLPNFLDLSKSPKALLSADAENRTKWRGTLKGSEADFFVCEPVPEYPGVPADLLAEIREKTRFLTCEPESDMPGLLTDQELCVEWHGRSVPAVAMTVVKNGATTWGVIDCITKTIATVLGRAFHHGQVLTSGLKDKRALTVQTFVLVNVKMSEIRLVLKHLTQAAPAANIALTTTDRRRAGTKKTIWCQDKATTGPAGWRGFFVKDARATDRKIAMGDHATNGFVIRVRVPGKSAAELEEYMQPRAELFRQLGEHIPDAFHRQRLGPNQDMQLAGLTLLTGHYEPKGDCYPFMSAVDAMMHRLVCESSPREGEAVRKVRDSLRKHWLVRFSEAAEELRKVMDRPGFNLSLEYEVVQRYANQETYGGCAEAILYDLRDRLSMTIGAVQGFYANHEIDRQAALGLSVPGDGKRIPLLMSCRKAEELYRTSELGREGLRIMAVTEERAARAEKYMAEFVEAYWREIATRRSGLEAELQRLKTEIARLRATAQRQGQAASERPARLADGETTAATQQPASLEMLTLHASGLASTLEKLDDIDPGTGLSFRLVRQLFEHRGPVIAQMTTARPDYADLSAALVRYLFLIPRDRKTGAVRSNPPKRNVFAKVNGFKYACEDGCVTCSFALPRGSYATMLISLFFNTADKREEELSPEETGGPPVETN